MENDDINDDATIRELVDAFRNGLHEKTLQRTPHLVLLDHEFYVSVVKDVISKRSLSWMKAHHVFDGLSEVPQHEDLLSYISKGNNSTSQNSIKRLETQGDIGENALQCLNLAHDWSSSFVPHILSKVDRVSFGLLQPQDAAILTPNQPVSRKLFGIPFVGKDVPSSAAEFAQPDVLIGATILAYRYEGLRESDLKTTIRILKENLHQEVARKSNVCV